MRIVISADDFVEMGLDRMQEGYKKIMETAECVARYEGLDEMDPNEAAKLITRVSELLYIRESFDDEWFKLVVAMDAQKDEIRLEWVRD